VTPSPSRPDSYRGRDKLQGCKDWFQDFLRFVEDFIGDGCNITSPLGAWGGLFFDSCK